ncbi:hypothetical protein CRENBAI_002322 [Crenichthys baileyi]|uniref:Uncharacterized protein n=1 Tax=Crenichthys baileyi TaxID=28760 RepID=A0AAV9R5F7_9TELE
MKEAAGRSLMQQICCTQRSQENEGETAPSFLLGLSDLFPNHLMDTVMPAGEYVRSVQVCMVLFWDSVKPGRRNCLCGAT